MHKFVRNLITEWRRLGLPSKDNTALVAVSGGADSVSLLLAVHDLAVRKKLGLRFVATHFNHKLRGAESDADEEFVRDLCIKLCIELAVGHGSLPPNGNLEQNARNARYSFLAETAERMTAFAVLTGHTVNDQAETFLLNLIRGSGPDGLGGMMSVRTLEEEKGRKGDEEKKAGTEVTSAPTLLVRPLLTWAKRVETESFCRDQGVDYRYDTMNDDTAFKRVRIRKILLPLLEDMNPNIVETLANTASLMQRQPSVKPRPNAGRIELSELLEMPQDELYDTLRSWLRANRGTTRSLQLKHIQSIERLIRSGKSGRVAEMPGNARVVKSGGKLNYEENKVEK